MGDKSKKSEDRPWSGALPTMRKPSLKTILDEAKKNKNDEDNGVLTGAFPTLKKPSIKKILKGKD